MASSVFFPPTGGVGLADNNIWTGSNQFDSPVLFADGSVAAPSIARAASPTNGFYFEDGVSISYSAANLKTHNFGKTDTEGLIGLFTAGVNPVYLVNDGAANILAQRNGTFAQLFRSYKTRQDALNYERIEFGYDAADGTFVIQNKNAGTGSFLSTTLIANILYFSTGASYAGRSTRWAILANGNLDAQADNSYDIGSAARKVANIFVGTSIDSPLYKVGGVSGADFGPGAVTSITVVKGIVTAIS